MPWRRTRWVALIGPLLGVTLFTVGPAVLNVVKLPGPDWVTTAVAALGGVLLLVATQFMQAHLDTLTQQTTLDTERVRLQEAAMQQLVGVDQDFRLVRDVTDRALLGIHPAIPLPVGADPRLAEELPTYIARDIDAALHSALRRASSTGGFILLTGQAASGKTRCAYEAVKTILGDWRLCMPASADTITALVDSDADLTRTVIWLNETQLFLGPGRLNAETVRKILADHTRPSVIIGTMWAIEYDRLSGNAASQNDQEYDWNSREILKLARRFTVKELSRSEQERARELTQADPRLNEALNSGGEWSRLTEILAASPELIDRWEQAADPLGAAIISAGVDARLCGHPEPIPGELLALLVPAYLTGAQRAKAGENWLEEALQWACTPVRGEAAPLTSHATEMGSPEGYKVSDILVQHAQRGLHERETPDQQWSILISNSTPYACASIGRRAYTSGRISEAEHAWMRAFEGGETYVSASLGYIHYRRGESEEAQRWWEHAVEEDGGAMAGVIGHWAYELHDMEVARHWWERAVMLSGQGAAFAIGDELRDQGDVTEARKWWERAVELGGPSVAVVIGQAAFEAGDVVEARRWWERAEAVSPTLTITIGHNLYELSHPDEARIWWERAVETGGATMAAIVGYWLLERDDLNEARVWWERAVDIGGATMALSVGLRLFNHGNIEESRVWWESAIEEDGPIAAVTIGRQLLARNSIEEAQIWLSRAAAAGNEDAAVLLENLQSNSNGG